VCVARYNAWSIELVARRSSPDNAEEATALCCSSYTHQYIIDGRIGDRVCLCSTHANDALFIAHALWWILAVITRSSCRAISWAPTWHVFCVSLGSLTKSGGIVSSNLLTDNLRKNWFASADVCDSRRSWVFAIFCVSIIYDTRIRGSLLSISLRLTAMYMLYKWKSAVAEQQMWTLRLVARCCDTTTSSSVVA